MNTLCVLLTVLAAARATPANPEDRFFLPPAPSPWIGSGIVPDIIDAPPRSGLKVMYGYLPVFYGRILTPRQVRPEPSYIRWNCDANKRYTLLFVDPDAPSRSEPSVRSVQHWAVGNIPGCNVASGDTIGSYFGSGPAEGSGYHRYVYLIYEQPGQITFPAQPFADRAPFDVRAFASQHNLQLVAGNFYHAEYDDSVPELVEQIQQAAQAGQ